MGRAEGRSVLSWCGTIDAVAPEAHAAERDIGSDDARLVLHIGLPKTASTFLQYLIFKNARDLILVHRARGRDEDKLARLVKRIQRVGEEEVGAKVDEANARLAQIYEKPRHQKRRAKGRTTLISQENISMGGDAGLWDAPRPTPSSVADRAAAWASSDAFPNRSIGVILGVRRQDQWVASRYAQGARDIDQFGEADFERRVTKLCDGELEGWWQWIDYAAALRGLAGRLGKDNVFVFPMEALETAPHQTLGRMGDFLGGAALADVYARAEQDPEERIRRNVKSVGPNTWQGRDTDATITLSESLASTIRARFKGSNQELSEAIGVDLQSLGYW